MANRLSFRSADTPEAARLREWHRKLKEQKSRGERARLRRSTDIAEAALAPAFHWLVRQIESPERELSPRELSELAALSILAAWVDTDSAGRRLGLTFGKEPGRQDASLGEARFRRLLESADLEDRFKILRRIVQQIGRTVDLQELAAALCDWTPHRRRQLAYDYYSGFAGTADVAASPAESESPAASQAENRS